MRAQSIILILVGACATNPAEPSIDDPSVDAKTDSGAVAFYNKSTGKPKTVAGLDATVYDLSPTITQQVQALNDTSSYGGVFAEAVRVSPTKLAAAFRNDAKLDDLIAGGAQYLDRGGYVTHIK